MKPFFMRRVVVAVMFGCGVPTVAAAADHYWDTNGTFTGFGTASGTWGTSNFWSNNSTGGAATFSTTITTSDIGNFGTGSDGLGAGTVTVTGTQVANGLSFGSASGAITLSGGTISLGGTTPTITVTNASNTISSVIAGSAGVIKNGTGSLTLGSNNMFTGGLSVNAGTLFASANVSFSTGTIFLGATSGSESATLSNSGGDRTWTNNLTVRAGSSGVKSIVQNALGSTSFTGNLLLDGNLTILQNQVSTMLKTTGVVSGNGSMALGGNSTGIIGFGGANTYTGGTTINPGVTVAVLTSSTGTAGNPTDGSFGAGTAAVVLNGGQMRASTGGARSVGNAVTLASNMTFVTIAGEQDLTFAGPVTMTASRTLTVDVGNSVVGRGVIIAGAIGDGGSGFGLTKAGAASGLLTLTGNNTFTGATAVTGGILNLGTSLALQNSPFDTATSIAGNATAGLRTTVTTLTLGGLTGDKNFGASGGVFTTTTNGYGSVTTLTLNPGIGATPSYAGAIANGTAGMNLIKSGAGTQTLNGTNTYTGTTTISGGTLALASAGTINNTSGVILSTGTLDVSAKGGGGYSTANLSGNGTVVGTLTVSNQLAIGFSPGTINFENLSLGNATTYLYEVTGGGSTADLGNVSAALNLGNATLNMVQLGTYTLGDKFTLFGYNSGNLTGTFNGLANGATFAAASGNWTINYADPSSGSNGGSGNLFITVTAVPEPACIGILAIGLSGLLMLRRRFGRA